MIGSLKNLDRRILKIVLGIYVPGFFIQLGASLTGTFNPLYSRELGADLAMVGIVAAAAGVGHILFDLPGGWLAGKVRERTFIMISVSCQLVCVIFKGFAQSPWHLIVINLVFGMATAAWGIGRLAYMRRRIPAEIRGRSLAFMGGIMRITRIITPALGGFIILYTGYRVIYFIQAAFTLVALATSLFMIEKGEAPSARGDNPRHVLGETFGKNGKNIIIAMAGITGLQLLRMSRNLLVPLWADSIGVSVEMIGTLTSATALIETAMVIPAGIVLDRLGRKTAVVPCTIGLGIGLALLPLSGGITGLALVMVLMALTNGIGSGINMTISSDLAPKRAASEFLGVWRFVTDSSQLIGPSVAGAIAQAFSLALAPVVLGAMGLAAGFLLLFGLEETKKNEKP